jgi:PGF-pre-PGF domain-containing protein
MTADAPPRPDGDTMTSLINPVTTQHGLVPATVLLLAIVLLLPPVTAAEHILSPGDSIQTAINSAADGDTISLNFGTYSQNGITVNKNITIRGNPATGSDRTNTFIDGGGAPPRIFTGTEGISLTIDSLTLRNGRAPDGLPSDRFDHTGFAGESGGAISSDGLVTVTSSIIRDCRAGNGGHGYDGSDGLFDPGTGGGDGGNGGAIFTSDEAVIDATTITYCFAGNGGRGGTFYNTGTGAKGGDGGAIYAMNFLTITSSSITSCTAGDPGSSEGAGGNGGNGGGIYTANYTYPISYMNIGFTTISNCSAGKGGDGVPWYDGGNGGSGGGIYSTWPATITSSTISKCNAAARGTNTGATPGVDGRGGAYGGFNYGGTLTLENSTLTGNWAPRGGAIGPDDTSQGEMRVTSSNISSNSATEWGAIYYWGTLTSTSSTFTGNSGGVIEVYKGDLHLNRFYNNAGTTVYCPYDTTMIEAQNNWWGTNSNPSGYKFGNVTYSPWLMLCATALPPSITTVHTSAVQANLTYNSAGMDTSASGFIPDNIPLAFAITSGGGGIQPLTGSTTNGANTSTYTPAAPGTATVGVTVDSQTVSTPIVVTLPPPPVITVIAPASGLTAGGTNVTITGTWFLGATDVRFGTAPATNLTVNSDTNITVTSPVHLAGTADVTITTPGGTSSIVPADEFTYIAPLPAVTSLAPAIGPIAGGTNVTLTGSGFIGATDVRFGTAPATNLTVNSDANITVTSPAHAAGATDVTVTTVGGTSIPSPSSSFWYSPVPAITSVLPVSGPVAGGTSVILTGTGFTGASDVQFDTSSGTGLIVDSDTQITVTSPAHIAGMINITIITPGGINPDSAGSRFYYAPIPGVAGIVPASGLTAGGTNVTITGTGFSNATAVRFGAVSGTNLTVDSDTQITITYPPQAEAIVDVTVTTPGGTSPAVPADQFTYIAPLPEITAISPAAGPIAGGTTVIITGIGFIAATDVRFNATAATSYTVNSDTRIAAEIPAGPEGPVNVNVTTAGGTSPSTAASRFTYANIPGITGIAPTEGTTRGGTVVTVSGTGFNGTTSVLFNTTPGTGLVVLSDTRLLITSPAQAEGTVDITVTAPGGTSLPAAADRFTFIVVPLPITIPQSVVPNVGDDGPKAIVPEMTILVNVGGNSAIGRVAVTGTGLSELVVTGTSQDGSVSIFVPPPGNIYQYIELVPARYTTINSAIITFMVPVSWLEENHLTQSDIVLYHYTGDTWVALQTTAEGTINGIVTFTAQSPGFSLYAIAGQPHAGSITTISPQVKSFGELAEQAPAPVVPTTVTLLPVQSRTTPTPSPPAAGQPEPGFPLAAIALIGAGCLVLAGAGWYIRRWWIRRQNPALFREYD